MKLQPGTKAYKAYHQGIKAFEDGKYKKSNPYVTVNVIGLSNWWVLGYDSKREKALDELTQLSQDLGMYDE